MSVMISVVNCGDPGMPDHGTRQGEVFTFGGQVVFTCNLGYHIQGHQVSRCQADASWDSSPPFCKGEPVNSLFSNTVTYLL